MPKNCQCTCQHQGHKSLASRRLEAEASTRRLHYWRDAVYRRHRPISQLNAHRGLKWAAEYLSEKLWRTFAGTVFLQTGCMVYCQTDRRFIGLILQGLANLWPGLNIYGRDCQIIRFVIRSYKVKTSLQADR